MLHKTSAENSSGISILLPIPPSNVVSHYVRWISSKIVVISLLRLARSDWKFWLKIQPWSSGKQSRISRKNAGTGRILLKQESDGKVSPLLASRCSKREKPLSNIGAVGSDWFLKATGSLARTKKKNKKNKKKKKKKTQQQQQQLREPVKPAKVGHPSGFSTRCPQVVAVITKFWTHGVRPWRLDSRALTIGNRALDIGLRILGIPRGNARHSFHRSLLFCPFTPSGFYAVSDAGLKSGLCLPRGRLARSQSNKRLRGGGWTITKVPGSR